MKHPALELFAEKTRQKIAFGDVKRPTEYDKDIVQESDTEVLEKAQFAYLARETAYISRHLERLVEEKIEGDVAEWYKRAERAFTYRLVPIQALYEDVEGVLARRLPNLREDFKAGFEKLLAEAGRCNIERVKWFGFVPVKPIRDFQSAAAEFHKTIYAIFEESLIALDKLTKQVVEQKKAKQASGKVDLPNEKSAEAEWDTTLSKFAKTIGWFKHVAEKGWQIFTKSFWEAVFERFWPK